MNDASRAAGSNDALYRAIFDAAALGVVLVDLTGRLVECNAAFASLLGHTTKDLVGRPISELTLPEDWPVERRRVLEFVESGEESLQFEKRHLHKDGDAVWTRVNVSLVSSPDGAGRLFVGVVEDITERKMAQQALRESEKTLRGLIENIPDIVGIVDRDLCIQYVNRGTGRLSVKDLVGVYFPNLALPEDHDLAIATFRAAFETRQVQHAVARDISGLWWSARFVPLTEGGEVRNVMVISTDITERREAEEAVGREQELLRQMLDLFERDRELVAFEIHDGFAQQLAGAALNFEAAEGLCEEFHDQAKVYFDEGLRLLRQSLEESRRLVRGLRPPVLDEFGIVPAVEHLIADHMAGGGTTVEFASGVNARRLAQPVESALFRIVQEALNNIRKHSRSDRARIELFERESSIHLVVEDFGVGFDPETVGPDHFGLRGIRERARLLGGTGDIHSSPGGGVRIHVHLPSVRPAPPASE